MWNRGPKVEEKAVSKQRAVKFKTVHNDNDTTEIMRDTSGKELVVVAETIGRRPTQEDAYDAGYMPSFATLNPYWRVQALKSTVNQLHKRLLREKKQEIMLTGSTFSGVVVCDDKIYTVNIGDSAALLAVKDDKDNISMTMLTKKWHSPRDQDEEARLNKVGVGVLFGRVSGMLAVSRAFGDQCCFADEGETEHWRNGVFCEPDIEEYCLESYPLPAGHSAMILNMCDGALEITKNSKTPMEDSAAYIKGILEAEWVKKNAAVGDVVTAIKAKAFSDGSRDNITVMGSMLDPKPTGMAKFFVLCDGHGGAEVSNFVARQFATVLENEIEANLSFQKTSENVSMFMGLIGLLGISTTPKQDEAIEMAKKRKPR